VVVGCICGVVDGAGVVVVGQEPGEVMRHVIVGGVVSPGPEAQAPHRGAVVPRTVIRVAQKGRAEERGAQPVVRVVVRQGC
jgi:hypothetical protein